MCFKETAAGLSSWVGWHINGHNIAMAFRIEDGRDLHCVSESLSQLDTLFKL